MIFITPDFVSLKIKIEYTRTKFCDELLIVDRFLGSYLNFGYSFLHNLVYIHIVYCSTVQFNLIMLERISPKSEIPSEAFSG